MRKLGYLAGKDEEGAIPMQPKTKTEARSMPTTAAKDEAHALATPKVPATPDKARGRPEDKPVSASRADFPPGLVVSEQAKQKMDEQKTKTKELSQKKEEKRATQAQRWQSRPEVVAKWQQVTAKFAEKRAALQQKWEEQDRRKAAQREEVIQRLTANGAAPAAIEAQKQRFAQEDTVDALKRADDAVKMETQELKEVEQAEQAQIRKDKFHNMVAGLLGWQKRQIPA